MGISAYLCKPGRLPQHVPQFLFCFSVLLPEDVTVWTINDRGLHTHTWSSTSLAELPKWFKSFCEESTTKSQLKGPGVKAELPNDSD